jgi:hypothetical protein
LGLSSAAACKHEDLPGQPLSLHQRSYDRFPPARLLPDPSGMSVSCRDRRMLMRGPLRGIPVFRTSTVRLRSSPHFRIKADLSTRGRPVSRAPCALNGAAAIARKTPLPYPINSAMFVLVAHLNRSAVPVSGRFEPSIELTAVNPLLSAFANSTSPNQT